MAIRFLVVAEMLVVSLSPSSPLSFLPVPNPRPFVVFPLRRCCLHKHHKRRQCRGGSGLPLHLLHAVARRRMGIVIDVDEVNDIGDRDLPVDVSFTRRLPPALTLVDGIAALRRAAEEVKASPPAAGSGVIRFEVLVPPSTKALKWLCSQFRRSSLFPQFYLSRKLSSNPSVQLEISGVGSALCLYGSSSQVKDGYDMISRYISFDSDLMGAYGAVGMKYNEELLSIEEKAGSFYFFIPQVELTEFVGYSVLSSTMVWDHFVSHTFEDSVCLFESCFKQVCGSCDSAASSCYEGMMTNYIGESHLLETVNAQLVYLDGEVLVKVDAEISMQKEKFLMSEQSFIRFSPHFLFFANMDLRSESNKTESSIKSCSNINSAWASLIVEECVRLGFTYFCIAPGSRSSPLALSATGHPLTTCISCYDERSLGFHALGYGRGSRKPAIVITSSGTAVSNLLPSVVEASQNFVPVILLTADRPPELHDAGANQAIDQL
ncbi:protein PHYLLO, chloroplastic-like [Triticum dicoccoides]|uniref:protein PHYLLO, chloroplastic-like n=1 Tax=Triticum dicoccoides TaxID=85692 RepID=UPI001891DBEB|nr:protein PHYLLO, chloroplastic-like [Triticum dicoccoides]